MSSSDSAKQSCAKFLALNHPIDTQRWQLALTSRVSGGCGSLFGGVGLAAGIVALEHATNKPVIWATGQYLSLTQLDEQLDLEVILPAIGRNVVQGRVVGHVGDREVITVIGAAGSRSSAAEGCWETSPAPAPADDCPPVRHGHGNAMGRIMHCTSLDNTIRFGRLEPTAWVLCDNRMEYAGNGFGHGTVHLWSEAGTLLATASQSMIVRKP